MAGGDGRSLLETRAFSMRKSAIMNETTKEWTRMNVALRNSLDRIAPQQGAILSACGG
ncbi:hypothetical protein LP421_21340 [Rhizobium sp. RCAM05350]|nr:hypothetical protein LP421_21340 [Rhizobium sp. RCAM05350]